MYIVSILHVNSQIFRKFLKIDTANAYSYTPTITEVSLAITHNTLYIWTPIYVGK